jgi:hypothetical protein
LFPGFFVAVNGTHTSVDLGEFEETQDRDNPKLHHFQPSDKTTTKLLTMLQNNSDALKGTLALTQQGKSKRIGVWTPSELYDSNYQLTELGPERSVEDFVLPDGGVEEGLCGQIVRIHRV